MARIDPVVMRRQYRQMRESGRTVSYARWMIQSVWGDHEGYMAFVRGDG